MMPKEENSLKTFVAFLKTGEIGPLSHESTFDEIVSLLGEPEGIDTYNDVNSPVDNNKVVQTNLYYSGLFLAFFGQELFQFNIEFKQSLIEIQLPEALHVDWYSTVREMQLSYLVRLLQKFNIKAQQVVTEFFEEDEYVIWIEESNLFILTKVPGNPQIYKISWQRLPIAEKYRQVQYQLKPISVE